MRFIERILLVALALAAAGLPSAAAVEAPAALVDARGLTVTLDAVEMAGGEATLLVRCAYEGGAALLTALDPRVNGLPAGLSEGWGSDFYDLDALADGGAARIILVPDDPGEAVEALSLRFELDGAVTSPAGVALTAGGFEVMPASFEYDAPLVLPPVPESAAGVRGWTITDRAPEAELEGACVRVCLRTQRGDEQLCEAEAEVGADGVLSARYSGVALVAAGGEAFPVGTVERDGAITTQGLSLSAEWIFSADLCVTLGADGGAGYLVESAELEEPIRACPFDTFDALHLRRNVWTAEERGAEYVLTGADSVFEDRVIDGPVALEAVDARTLGEIVVYAEYTLKGGGYVAHRVEMTDSGGSEW